MEATGKKNGDNEGREGRRKSIQEGKEAALRKIKALTTNYVTPRGQTLGWAESFIALDKSLKK
jgi:hypothetical protein